MRGTRGIVLATALIWALAAGAAAADPLTQRLAELGSARERLLSRFAAAAAPYPPRAVVLAAFKQERRLEVHARSGSGPWRTIAAYPILGLGRGEGPKLRQGDRRTPEGVYRVTHLNPQSRFHLSLLLDYPNRADRAWAAADGRTDLGGDIVIHGGAASIGCVAVGDDAVEELFVLAAAVGVAGVETIIAPWDFRVRPPVHDAGDTTNAWVGRRYAEIAQRLAALPSRAAAASSGLGAGPAAVRLAALATSPADYPAVKRDVAARQAALNRAYRAARDDSSRAAVLAAARSFLEDAIVRRLLPPWLGTPWDYNGTSEQPGAGSIACGFFVTTVLRDAGFRIDRARLARLPSEQLIRSFCDPRDVQRFSGAPAPGFVAAVLEQGPGLFIVGLDYHVGFLVSDGREVRFVHSTVVGAGKVVDEPALDSGPLVWSRYRVIGRVLSDRVVARWLETGGGPARADAGALSRALPERGQGWEVWTC